MCERTYCRHEHERLCSCPPVACRDALGMAAHLAENMEQVQWSLTYNSLKDIKPYQLCLVGKCRICGGRLCMEQRPVEADSTDGFLAAVYRHLYHFHRSIGQCLPRAAFRTKFVEMFRKEDRAAIEDWLALPENSHVARMYRRSVKGAYTIVHSWADADQGEFPSPSGVATFTDREKARAELNRLVTEEKENMEIPFSKELYREEYGNDFWEAYPNAGTPKVFICAMHPTNPECADLLTKKDSDLRKIIETRDIPCEDKTRNSAMRTAIWSYYGDDLQVNSVELDVTKGDAKPIWEKLQKYLPVYSLFQADRKNSDSDSEVQDPLHAAVKEILQDEDISQTLDHVAEIVEGKLQEVATRTLEKLREMSPDIANTLSPVIPPASSLKWADVFKSVTISGDESIPINKRGSGSKRLILLNFFRAEVERRKDEANAPGIIYAIEEPETSQHSENQKKLINALIALSTESNVQVIVTTHSAVLVNALDFKNIRLICADGSQKRVEAVRSGQLPFPSLNEVNYLAFSEISEGYHDELYGYLEEQGWLNEYKQGKTTVPYKKISANGTTREQQICMTEYIRHQIHHPENTYNARFNDSQLRRSIEDMRAFVTSKAQTPETT